jgi:hypothetical protein
LEELPAERRDRIAAATKALIEKINAAQASGAKAQSGTARRKRR